MTAPDWTALVARVLAETPHTPGCAVNRFAYDMRRKGWRPNRGPCNCDRETLLVAKLGRGIPAALDAHTAYYVAAESREACCTAAARAFAEAP